MQYAIGAFAALAFVLAFVAFRLLQFWRRYERVCRSFARERASVIVMHDHYRDTAELTARLDATARLYDELEWHSLDPSILLTSGRFKGASSSMSVLNKQELGARRIPHGSIDVFLGDGDRGAGDTYQEVALACRWLRDNGHGCAYFVGSPLQLFQVFYSAVFNGIYPRLHPVESSSIEPIWIVARLLMGVLVFFDPRGWNPVSFWIRFRRRHIVYDM
ncbi:MAG: hypothetical protein A3G60_01350 [Candidatus Ryanbacteria bacterium RIFCSPLOWO2_12_FULL_47_9c]|uniref:DUF218 domain-containing protein n=2 Tax=Candidatus Ryaniibacteriota TaxID=1817914 RepID=A0A1G2H5B9_9BACT|nr:MAG: hypothetical protein UX74_C0029G0005 [Parcubacteria group bacterium GW2011_GWA2_47_10b]OGZ55439.1 MAG: hypothetical protein A3J04_03455 [Candidatus Ryanbacteria bacterium RIFCSPLOWO2_02_FULL_47_14]OGZ57401.1 MAG: hypothetical protein A3G60_01350 [Candidatus Ryanbacteria bacterium RIFCSPLOWO2_12_FULL_47_9c]